MATATITSAADNDGLVAVAKLLRTYAASLSVDLAYQDFETELSALPGKYAPPRGVLLLARSADGTPLGCVAMRPMDTARCEMKRLYVEPEGRGLGLGRRLVEALVEEARRIGYREMCLDTLPEMSAAQSLYRGLGFEPVEPYYDTPVAGTAFLRLRLDA